MTAVIASESTYGAKKISRSSAAPAQRAVEQQRDAERERELDDERERDEDHVVLHRAAGRAASPKASR